MAGNPRRGRHALLGLIALAFVALWFGAWEAFGGARPLQVYRLNFTQMLSANEARVFVGAALVQLVAGAWVALWLAPRLDGGAGRRLGALLARPQRFYFAMALIAAELAYVLGAFALAHTSYSEDEKTYLFQARLLLSGHLTMPRPDLHEAFFQPFVVEANGRWSGQYFWAQPALLAVGMLVRAPYVVPALEVFVAVFFGAKLAHEYAREPRAGLAAAVLLGTSPLLVQTGATLHNASLAAACAAVSLWGVVALTRRRSVAATVALGLSTGVALHNRPLEHAALLAGAAALLGWTYRRKLGALVRRLAPAVLLALPFAALHLPINRALSGNVLHGGYWLFNDTRHWRTFGFGVGPFGYPYNPGLAAQKTFTNVVLLFFYTTGSPHAFAATLPAVSGRLAARRLAAPLALVAATLGIHFFAPFYSVRPTGPVYCAPLALLLGAWIGVALAWQHARLRRRDHPVASRLVPAALVAQVALALLTLWPPQVAELVRVGATSRRCEDAFARAGIHSGLVFVQPPTPNVRPQSWSFHPPMQLPDLERPELLFANFTYADQNQRVAQRYARGRPIFVEWCIQAEHPTIASYDPYSGAFGVIAGPPPSQQ